MERCQNPTLMCERGHTEGIARKETIYPQQTITH